MIDASFLDKAANMGETKVLEVNGLKYSTKQIFAIREKNPDTLKIDTLVGFAEFVNIEMERFNREEIPVGKRFIGVQATSAWFMETDVGVSRETVFYARTDFAPSGAYPFGQFLEIEDFIIRMQTSFIMNEDAANILKIVGNLEDSNVRQYADSGTSQEVTARIGLTNKKSLPLPNPVTLAPIRTFLEVAQPESKFIFRMMSGTQSGAQPKAALFDYGDHWKLMAIANIKAWLKSQVPSAIKVIG